MDSLIHRLRRAGATTMILIGIIPPLHTAQAAVANTINFQGRLLASPTAAAASTTFQMRFSIWADSDFVDGTDRSAGSLVGAAWEEVQTFTTDSQGFFILEVGSSTALPNFDSATHRYLQAEVKSDAAADTTYFLLDNMAFNDSVDRKSVLNSAYAQNAKQLDGKELGFDPGDIPYLDENGQISRDNLDLGAWHDPVANVAALDGISNKTDGSVAYVTGENSLYTYNGSSWDKVGNDLQSSLDTLTSTVGGNSSSISVNTSAIASNTSAIQSNDTNIAANLAAILSNDTDIAANLAATIANDTDIAANLASIQSNDTDIAANLAAILANDTDIAANLAAILANDSDIAANLASIIANDTDIAANLASIQSNDTDIAANLAAIQSNDTDITAVNAELDALDADVYRKAAVDNLISTAIQGLSWKDPVASVAALSTTYTSPTDGDTAYVSGTGEIYTYNGSSWVKTGADFFQNATTSIAGIVELAADGEIAAGKAVQSNDSRLAQVATNTTNITTNASNITTNASGVATNLAAIQSNDSDIATNLAAIQSNDTDISTNLAAIQSNDTDIAANLAAIQSNDTDIAGNTTDIAANLAAIQSNDTDISTNVTNISTNTTDISTNDTEIASLQNNFASVGFDVFILPQ